MVNDAAFRVILQRAVEMSVTSMQFQADIQATAAQLRGMLAHLRTEMYPPVPDEDGWIARAKYDR